MTQPTLHAIECSHKGQPGSHLPWSHQPGSHLPWSHQSGWHTWHTHATLCCATAQNVRAPSRPSLVYPVAKDAQFYAAAQSVPGPPCKPSSGMRESWDGMQHPRGAHFCARRVGVWPSRVRRLTWHAPEAPHMLAIPQAQHLRGRGVDVAGALLVAHEAHLRCEAAAPRGAGRASVPASSFLA
eukprot:365619-Chlamydomonas_euryale.AAC.13